jgi:hypothetical protein
MLSVRKPCSVTTGISGSTITSSFYRQLPGEPPKVATGVVFSSF